jgi:beta-N-acetylhexosaminidase
MSRLRHSLLASTAALVLAAPAAAAVPAGETIVSALAGPPKPSFLAQVRTGEIGGVILVGRWSPAEFSHTTATLHAAGCAVGFARRLTWAAPWDSEGLLGRNDSAAHVQMEATPAAAALRAAGVDVDLAPVTDTLGPHGFLGDRSYGADPAVVGRLASTFVAALQAGGVAAAAKHFPGLGAAKLSTDDSSQRGTRRAARLQRASISSCTRAAPQRTSATSSSPPTRRGARQYGHDLPPPSREFMRCNIGSAEAARARGARARRRCGASAAGP